MRQVFISVWALHRLAKRTRRLMIRRGSFCGWRSILRKHHLSLTLHSTFDTPLNVRHSTQRSTPTFHLKVYPAFSDFLNAVQNVVQSVALSAVQIWAPPTWARISALPTLVPTAVPLNEALALTSGADRCVVAGGCAALGPNGGPGVSQNEVELLVEVRRSGLVPCGVRSVLVEDALVLNGVQSLALIGLHSQSHRPHVLGYLRSSDRSRFLVVRERVSRLPTSSDGRLAVFAHRFPFQVY